MPRQDLAIQRATQLDNWHASRGTTGDNPSTGVHRLIQQINAACGSPKADS